MSGRQYHQPQLQWTCCCTHIVYGDWTLVFRAQSAINKSLYDTWKSVGLHHDNPIKSNVPEGCLRFDNVKSCNQHFRSHILDSWENIQEVRFSIYKGGTEVKYIVFDGRTSTWYSWFARERILSSSWADLQSIEEPDYFSLKGYRYRDSTHRSFYIGQPHRRCPTDVDIVIAMDKASDLCKHEWHLNTDSYPRFLYSPLDGYASTGGFDTGDVLAVFVKF